MVVEDRVNSQTDNYMCEISVSGVNTGSSPDGDGRSSSIPGDRHGSSTFRKMKYETQESIYSMMFEDENGAIKSIDDFMVETDIKSQKSADEISVLPKALDGGFGWVICCGVFMIHMIFGGLGRCEGLFFLQFQSKFDTSAQLAAWPGSLMATLNLFMGPVCGAVVNRYSSRAAMIIGTSLFFIGIFLTAFAPNIYFLFLSHTLLEGTGRGLMVGILLLNLYFDKHRSLATGFGMSGVGIGSLWVVPLTQFLFDEYDFTGAFMILAALSLHGYLIAMMLRPLSMHYRFIKSKHRKSISKPGNIDENIALTADSNGNLDKQQINNAPREIDSDVEKLSTHTDKFVIESNSETLSEKIISTDQELILEETKDNSLSNSTSLSLPVTTQPSSNTAVTLQDGVEPLLESSFIEKQVWSEQSKHDEDNCCRSSIKICFPVEFKQKGETRKKKAFHWNLLKHVPFMIFCTSNFLFILAFKTAFTFLPAIAMSKGLSKQEAALVLTISGALDTFGRMAFGFIMDLRHLRPLRPYVFNLLLFIIAAASLVIPSLTTFVSFSIVCSVYGFLTGAFIAQKMVVIVDILGREVMPSSLGIQKVFQGFGTLIGPPFAGALRDALGSYDSSFYLGGASMIGAGLFLFLSTLLLRVRNRKP